MKFRGLTYRDYDPERKVSLVWDNCEQGEYGGVEAVSNLPEDCFEMLHNGLKDELLYMRCERDGIDIDEVSTDDIVLEKDDEEEILRIIVDRIMFSLVRCQYSNRSHMRELIGEWLGKELLEG